MPLNSPAVRRNVEYWARAALTPLQADAKSCSACRRMLSWRPCLRASPQPRRRIRRPRLPRPGSLSSLPGAYHLVTLMQVLFGMHLQLPFFLLLFVNATQGSATQTQALVRLHYMQLP